MEDLQSIRGNLVRRVLAWKLPHDGGDTGHVDLLYITPPHEDEAAQQAPGTDSGRKPSVIPSPPLRLRLGAFLYPGNSPTR